MHRHDKYGGRMLSPDPTSAPASADSRSTNVQMLSRFPSSVPCGKGYQVAFTLSRKGSRHLFLLKEKRPDTNNLHKLLEVRRVLAEQTSNRRRSLPSNSAELFLSGGPVAHRETPCIRSRDPARAIEVP